MTIFSYFMQMVVNYVKCYVPVMVPKYCQLSNIGLIIYYSKLGLLYYYVMLNNTAYLFFMITVF